MDKELKAKWIEALRSGKYSQASNVLHSCSGGFCCLGVLCDISGFEWNVDDRVVSRYQTAKTKDTYYLPADFAEKLGLNNHKVYIGVNHREGIMSTGWGEYGYTLADLNDSGFTFDQIADVIEYFL